MKEMKGDGRDEDDDERRAVENDESSGVDEKAAVWFFVAPSLSMQQLR